MNVELAQVGLAELLAGRANDMQPMAAGGERGADAGREHGTPPGNERLLRRIAASFGAVALRRGTMTKRKPLPKPDPTHWTLKPAGTKQYQGTYFRRLEDIEAGLIRIYDSPMPEGGRFLYLYYGCEKLGRGIVGIHKMWDAKDAYDQSQPLHLSKLKTAVASMKLAIADAELDALFVSDDKTTARYWRNTIAHDFGPSNVQHVVNHSAALNGKMRKFLINQTPPVLDFLKKTYAHLLP